MDITKTREYGWWSESQADSDVLAAALVELKSKNTRRNNQKNKKTLAL